MAKATAKSQIVQVTKFEEEALQIPATLKDEDELLTAVDLVLKVNKMSKDVDAARKLRTAPASETIKLINEDYKKYLDPLQRSEKKLRTVIEDYANRVIQSDLAKLAEIRETTGDNALIIPIGFKSIPGQNGEVRFRRGYTPTIIDIKKVPKKYLKTVVDEDLMQADIDATEGTIKIAGVVITQTCTTALYAK